MTGRRTGFLGAALLVALTVAAANISVLTPLTRQAVDDIGQLVGAIAAATALWWTGHRVRGADRRWRWLLGTGVTCWAVGQAIWSWYQLIRGTDVPSPSLADAGYLGLPVFALPALALVPTMRGGPPGDWTTEGGRRPRHSVIVVVDAVVVTLSLLVLTWTTALGAAVHDGGSTPFALSVAITYPVTDVLMVVLVLLVLALRQTSDAQTLILIGLGLVAIAVSDSLFVYLVASGGDRFTPLADAGFVAGPVLVALGALAPRRTPAAVSTGDPTFSRLRLAGPYLPLGLLIVVAVSQQLGGHHLDRPTIGGCVALVVLVIVRQYLTLIENNVLLERVRDGHNRLRYQAFHDPLTGLANRALFSDRLAHAAELSRRELRPLALLFLDLDDFKRVNDTLGHAAGDELLRIVADRLRVSVRSAETVARLGGDEFAVLLESEWEVPDAVGTRILEALRRDVVLAGSPYQIRASVGLVVADRTDATLSGEVLLRRADVAMYAAKRAEGGSLVVYRPGMTAPWRGRPLEAGHSAAPRRGPAPAEISVVYQPIVRLSDGHPVALEALARWEDPAYGAVSPEIFIPMAERDGTIAALDDTVLDLACGDLARLRAADAGLTVHVNVSASRLGDDQLAQTVAGALERYALPGDALVLEITETATIPNVPAAAAVLDRVRSLGVRIALDDVGAGHSSIAELVKLPIDIVKLDRSLIQPTDSGTGRERAAARRAGIVRTSVIRMAHALGATLVAEGIESEAQAAMLLAESCDLGQGFLYAPGVPVGALHLAGDQGRV